MNIYQQFVASNVNGYELKPETDNQSLKISITVDLKKLDRGQLTYNHAANQFTNVEYNLDADETTIRTALQAAGYICAE